MRPLILIRKLSKYTFGYRAKLLCVVVMEALDLVLELIQPLVWGYIITDICQLHFDNIKMYLIVVLSISSVQIVIKFGKEYLAKIINEGIEKDVRVDVYSKVLNLPMIAFDEMGEGDVLDRLEGDVITISSIFTSQLLQVVVNIVKAILIGVVVFRINWILAIIIVAFLPLTYFVMKSFGKMINKQDEGLRENTDKYYSYVQNTIKSIRDIKSLGLKIRNAKAFDCLIEMNKNMQVRLGKIMAAMNGAVGILSFISQISILIAGIVLIQAGMLKVELFIAIVSYSGMLSVALMTIAQINPDLQEAVVSGNRIYQVLDEMDYEQEKFGNAMIRKTDNRIEFRNVSFSYKDGFALNNISFVLDGYGKYVFCGESGSGKSTILNLLLKLYKPDFGTIELNGENIDNLSEKELRNYISIVSQEPFLFNIDIYSNLILNNTRISLEEVKEVCTKVNINDFIESLPNGYKTVLNNSGEDFSVGQKQRMAIARSIIAKSKVIVFDESTTGLDGESKATILDVINELKKDHILIVVDHRMTGIKDADCIVVIKDGEVQMCGKHEKLLLDSKEYRKMFKIETSLPKKDVALR
ncbi:MAG: ABC transporter ATP-binding protein [Eubacteriaceae bacterium]|nr:ABC transporter ATP-binding protein [Eubacteriaceae bacterium]